MLEFNQIFSEINKDIESEYALKKDLSLEEQAEKINKSVDNLNNFVNTVSEEFTKKFQEMHEIYFNGNGDNEDNENNDINDELNPTDSSSNIEE